jgi:hypothetical protein
LRSGITQGHRKRAAQRIHTVSWQTQFKDERREDLIDVAQRWLVAQPFEARDKELHDVSIEARHGRGDERLRALHYGRG